MTKPRTTPKVITGHRELVAYLEQRRLNKGLSHADLQGITGTHTGFNYVVSGRTNDMRLSTALRIIDALGLEIEIRPKAFVSRTQRVIAARKAANQSEPPPVGAEG